jgi:hypothetical protein
MDMSKSFELSSIAIGLDGGGNDFLKVFAAQYLFNG